MLFGQLSPSRTRRSFFLTLQNWEKRDLEETRFSGRLGEKIVDAEIDKDEAVRELGQLIQDSRVMSNTSTNAEFDSIIELSLMFDS